MRLNTDDLIKLAETGKTDDIELDDMAKAVLHECLYMLNFEKNIMKGMGQMEDRFKFRAWDSISKEYIVDQYALYELFVNDDDSYQIEQCTGTKDKNGKLIYEGDIVSVPELYNDIPTGKTRRYKVLYKHATFNIHGVKPAFLEVIGNIHENSEIMEEK